MAIALVANTSASGNAPTTGGINTSGATLLIVEVSGTSGTLPISDSRGNTWVSAGTTTGIGGGISKVWYSYNKGGSALDVGSSHTFTGDANTYGIVVVAFSGTLTHASDPYDTTQSTSGSPATSIQPASLTPSENNCVVVAALGAFGAGSESYSINGGFTITNQLAYTGGAAYGQALAYLIQTTAAAAQPTWSWVTSNTSGARNISFKSDPGVGGGLSAGTQLITFTAPIALLLGGGVGTTNLQAFWEFEDFLVPGVDSHGSNFLTDVNTVLATTGKVGYAADFEQSLSQYLTIADNAALSMGSAQSMTVCAWVKLESTGAARIIAGKLSSSNGDYYLFFHGGLVRFAFSVSSDGTYSGVTQITFNGTGLVQAGQWYFIVAWYDHANSLLGIQVDNATAETGSYSSGIYDGTTAFNIGSDGSGTFMDGLIDQVGIWKRVLTADERTWLYNGGAGRSYDEIDNVSGPITLAAGDQVITFTSPATTFSLGAVNLLAGSQVINFNAPDAILNLGAGLPITLVAGSQTITFSSPEAAMQFIGLGLATGGNTITFTNQGVLVNVGPATIVAGNQVINFSNSAAILIVAGSGVRQSPRESKYRWGNVLHWKYKQ